MSSLVMVLSRVVAGGFILLGVATVVSWIRHRDRIHGFLAGALGLLSVSSLVGQITSLTGYKSAWLGFATTAAFLGSGYALLGLRDSFIPIGRVARRAVVIGLVLLTAFTLAVLLTTKPKAVPGPLQWADFLLLLGAWSACVGEPAVRFWLAARGRPLVQSRRLRSLSAGYLGIVAVLVVSTATGFRNLPVEIAAQVASLCVIPLLYASFAPPRWLRRWWRQPEEAAFAVATAELLLFAPDRTVMATGALDWAVRLMGADGGAIIIDGAVVAAAKDLDGAAALELASSLRSTTHGEALSIKDVDGRHALLMRLRSDVDDQALIVVGGPFTPLFGGDELERLRQYAAYLASALERVRLVEALRTQTRRNDLLLEAASELGEGVVMTDVGRIVYANDAFIAIIGYTLEELQRAPSLVDLVVPEERELLTARLRECPRQPQVGTHYEAVMLAKGNRRIVTENAVRLLPEEGPGRVVAFVRDITVRRRAEDDLEAAARVDAVTQVPNRRAWDEELARALARAKRSNQPLCIAMLDLDRFKSYNDDWGHQRGDRLLQEVAGLWMGSLRQVDFLARYGGDEFAVIIADSDVEGAQAVLARLATATLGHQTISVGLAAWDHEQSAEGPRRPGRRGATEDQAWRPQRHWAGRPAPAR